MLVQVQPKTTAPPESTLSNSNKRASLVEKSPPTNNQVRLRINYEKRISEVGFMFDLRFFFRSLSH